MSSAAVSKADLSLCEKLGCRQPAMDGSHHCLTHWQTYWYIDLAYQVSIGGRHRPKCPTLKTVQIKERKIIDTYFKAEVQRQMNDLTLPRHHPAQPCQVQNKAIRTRRAICGRSCSHVSYEGVNYCPMHLRACLMGELRTKLKLSRQIPKYLQRISYQLPQAVQDECDRLWQNLPPIEQFMPGCRYFGNDPDDKCNGEVDDFPDLGYCKKHLGSPQAIQTMLKRQFILESGLLIKDLLEMLASAI